MPLPSTLSDAQLLARTTGITGSEIAALAGCSTYRAAIDVYASKVGDSPAPPPDGPHLERGVFLEDGILRWYAYRTGRRLEYPGTVTHPTLPLVIATPDAVAHGHDEPPRVVEVKAPDWRSRNHWGVEGTDQIPPYYLPQVQWELAVTGLQHADVVALLDGDLQIFTVEFNPAMFGALYTVARLFWDKHVRPGIPPPPEASQSYGEFLRRKFPEATQPALIDTPVAAADALAQLAGADAQLKRWQAEHDAAKHTLMALLGEHDGMEGAWGRIYYRNNKPSPKVNYKALVAELAPPAALLEKHTHKPATGPRVFRCYIKDTGLLLGTAANLDRPSLPAANPGAGNHQPPAPAAELPGPVAKAHC